MHVDTLQASTERSRRLYLRHGFQDIETWHGAFPVFLMWRPAGGAADANSKQPVAADGPGDSTASQQENLAVVSKQAHAERLVESIHRSQY